MSRFVFFNFSGLEKATVLNDTYLIKKDEDPMYKGCLKNMSRFVFYNFSELEKATVMNDTFLKCILKELSKTVFKSFLRQFLREI